MERGVGGATAGTRHAGDRYQRVGALAIGRRRTEDVQAVADLHLLQFAEMGIEGTEGGAAVGAGEPEIAVQAVALGEGDDLGGEVVAAAFVDAGGEVVFVDQRLELGERPVDLGARHRRHQMIDDDRRGAALRLAALAGVVDEERIDQRRRPQRDLRPAGVGQTERLAGQPFEVAVLADMDDGIGGELGAKPGVEREVVVRRDEVGIVVGRLRIDGVAALRLDADDDIAEAMDGKAEGTVDEERIGFRFAPAGGECGADGFGESGEEGQVGGEREGGASPTSRHSGESRNPSPPLPETLRRLRWTPAFAGVTKGNWSAHRAASPSAPALVSGKPGSAYPASAIARATRTVLSGLSRPTPLAMRPSRSG